MSARYPEINPSGEVEGAGAGPRTLSVPHFAQYTFWRSGRTPSLGQLPDAQYYYPASEMEADQPASTPSTGPSRCPSHDCAQEAEDSAAAAAPISLFPSPSPTPLMLNIRDVLPASFHRALKTIGNRCAPQECPHCCWRGTCTTACTPCPAHAVMHAALHACSLRPRAFFMHACICTLYLTSHAVPAPAAASSATTPSRW